MPWMRATSDTTRSSRRLLVAGVRTRRGDDRAGEHDDRGRREDEPGHPAHRVVTGRHGHQPACRRGRRLGGAAPRRRHQHHRDQEVAHHEAGGEVEQHHHAAERDLGEHADDEADRQPREVAPVRHPPKRAEHGQDHQHRHEPGDRPVDELHHRRRVGDRRGELALLAGRPVAAPESRTGQADDRAGDDDRRQRQQREQGHPAIRGRRTGVTAEIQQCTRTLCRPCSGSKRACWCADHGQVVRTSCRCTRRSGSLSVLVAPARRWVRRSPKPRIIELLLVTTVPTMVVAERGCPRCG